jgi:hypothetical protein
VLDPGEALLVEAHRAIDDEVGGFVVDDVAGPEPAHVAVQRALVIGGERSGRAGRSLRVCIMAKTTPAMTATTRMMRRISMPSAS